MLLPDSHPLGFHYCDTPNSKSKRSTRVFLLYCGLAAFCSIFVEGVMIDTVDR